MLLALEYGIPIDRVIQASGHGKYICDSQGGLDKTLLDLFFGCLVANPEELIAGLKRVEVHDRNEEGLVSLAEVCHRILTDPERINGAKSHKNRAKNRKIDERRPFVRPVGDASGAGLKFVCKGFQPGCGLRAHYHIRADPELAGPHVIAMRRFPCFCKGCVKKMWEPIATRYTGHSDSCDYWEIFEGHNDWKLIQIVPKPKVYVAEDDLARKQLAMSGIGDRMASQTKVGQIGAYIADDDAHDYYLFKCTHPPQQADKDFVTNFGGNEFVVKEGEKYCHGLWLDKVSETAKWFVVTEDRCIVRMQVVVDAKWN